MIPSLYGYIRVSSDHQADSGLGLKAQTDQIRDAFRRLVSRYKLRVAEIISDPAISATRRPLLMRDGGKRLDSLLQAGDHLVIAKLDRAFRSQRDCVLTCEAWIDRGVVIHFLDIGVGTDTPMGRMMMGILSTVAQWESARIGERIRDAKAAQRSTGHTTNGQRVLGYRVLRGKLVPFPAERRLGTRAALWRSKGKLLREIAELFNRQKIKRPLSRAKWNPQSINRLIERHKAGWPSYVSHR